MRGVWKKNLLQSFEELDDDSIKVSLAPATATGLVFQRVTANFV